METAILFQTLTAAPFGSTSASRILDSLINEACSSLASDIHFDPLREALRIRLRIDGILTDSHCLTPNLRPEIISRIKVLAGLRTDEHFVAQDGRFRHTLVDGQYADIRVSITPTFYGENAVLRILADHGQFLNLDSLGFGQGDRKKVNESLEKPDGMIVVTGPTGSGKTSTLYTLLKTLHTPGRALVTIEDPIEYAIEGIKQIPVHAKTGLTFAQGLRAVLRQDPDIIMVGEIRDMETAHIAIHTALTGHLLFSTLHTNGALEAIPRLFDLKSEPYLIASTLRLIIAQRLVRKICQDCREVVALPEEIRNRIKAATGKKLTGLRWYAGKGCATCDGTGYRGRTAIFEVVQSTTTLVEAINRRAPLSELRECAKADGMRSLFEDGVEKALAGDTTIAEVLQSSYV